LHVPLFARADAWRCRRLHVQGRYAWAKRGGSRAGGFTCCRVEGVTC
jgi:hypothetical protein